MRRNETRKSLKDIGQVVVYKRRQALHRRSSYDLEL
jgi:hypothetical protein